MAEVQPLAPLETLIERFGRYVKNKALSRYRNRALPNAGDPTNEGEVHEFMQKDDEAAFVDAYRERLTDNDGK